MRFIGVEVEQETSAPPPKKNPGSTPALVHLIYMYHDPSDLGSLILIQTIPKERTLR